MRDGARPRSASSAGRASTRSSTTSGRSRSTRPTGLRRTASSWQRSAAQGRLPASPRPPPYDSAAPDQLPGQRLGDAIARGEGGHLALRCRSLHPRQARRFRRLRPVRRPDVGPAPHLLRRPDRDPPVVGGDLRSDAPAARDRDHPRPRHRGPRTGHGGRHRGPALLDEGRSRSGSRMPAGRSST